MKTSIKKVLLFSLFVGITAAFTIEKEVLVAHSDENVTTDTVQFTRQSPIDIPAEQTVEANIPDMDFNYPNSIDAKVINTGSPDHYAAVKAKVAESDAYVTYNGEKYNLLQFHWHTMSEHELSGKEFPMEVHFVHQKEGATELNDLLVVGIWYEVGEANPELDKLFAKLPEGEHHYEKVHGVDINGLFPQSFSAYQYEGSLTTPPFTESVHWVVLTEPVSVTQVQLDAYKTLFPHGNTRAVQPLNGRTVSMAGF